MISIIHEALKSTKLQKINIELCMNVWRTATSITSHRIDDNQRTRIEITLKIWRVTHFRKTCKLKNQADSDIREEQKSEILTKVKEKNPRKSETVEHLKSSKFRKIEKSESL